MELLWGGAALCGWDALFDNLKVGYDADDDDDLDGSDDVVIDEDFSSTSVAPTHDDAGNLTKDADYAYVYDGWNNLVRVKAQNDADVVVGVYAYYADNRRASKTVTNRGDLDGTTYFFYDGLREIEERNGSEQVTQQYVWGHEYIDQLLMIRGAGGTWFVHQDANWNVIALTTPSGDVAEEYQYQPYGLPQVRRHLAFGDADADGDVDSTDNTAHTNALTTYNRAFDADFDGDVSNTTGDADQLAWDASYNDPDASVTMVVPNRAFSPTGNPFLFTGRRLDAETGLYYYRFRTYHPGLKTFIQRDPLGYVDSASLYQYVGGRPTAAGDPLGLLSYVGNDGPNWHHFIPQKFYDFVKDILDIDASECGWMFPNFQEHAGKSTGASEQHKRWMKLWQDFFDANPNPSLDDILRQLGTMLSDKDFSVWLSKGGPATKRYPKSKGRKSNATTAAGSWAVGQLVNQLLGAAATFENMRSSPAYWQLIGAVMLQDWARAYRLIDDVERDVLLNANDRTNVDVGEYLTNLVDQAKAQYEEIEKQKKDAHEKMLSDLRDDHKRP
ncbi:MAG: RHS repeat-associated core domain-containing protein [Planctomycetia bacterium]|nr:RHS repeat-associated core domain-containing protein [Planctomycetia bacterium]